jgi:hypothetical protein
METQLLEKVPLSRALRSSPQFVFEVAQTVSSRQAWEKFPYPLMKAEENHYSKTPLGAHGETCTLISLVEVSPRWSRTRFQTCRGYYTSRTVRILHSSEEGCNGSSYVGS